MKILAICGKDIRHAFRSLFGLMFMFGIPFLLTGLFYFAFGGASSETPQTTMPPAKLVLVNEGAGDKAGNLQKMFSNASLQETISLLPVTDQATAMTMLENGETDGVLLLPALNTQPAELVVQQENATQSLILRSVVASILDAEEAQSMLVKEAQNGLAITDAVSARWQQAFSESGIERVTTTDSGANAISIVQQIIPNIMSAMMIFFAFFTAAYGAQSILTEEQNGTLQRMFISGSQRQTVLAGKFLAVWLTVVVQVGLTLFASGLLFKIAWGNPAGQLLLSLGIGTAAAGFGILVVSFLRSQRSAGLVMSGAVMVSGFVGVSAVFTGSGKITASALFVPQGWALQGLFSLQGGDTTLWLRAAGVLILWGVVLFTAGKLRFDHRYAREA